MPIQAFVSTFIAKQGATSYMAQILPNAYCAYFCYCLNDQYYYNNQGCKKIEQSKYIKTVGGFCQAWPHHALKDSKCSFFVV